MRGTLVGCCARVVSGNALNKRAYKVSASRLFGGTVLNTAL
jgi:hypothetical protein